ncbi:alpha/beta fold hydrolase [Streptomyces sp. Ag109_O5-1]|uniref:alpha/beta fold hydrolase n=1 Tax=Streptomyces sp. Ag109_O5-1 TaxID=1938851 RepID=UPI0021A95363|nr:hypothetical protein [Streptomyces sp. Ag109_O5-1]
MTVSARASADSPAVAPTVTQVLREHLLPLIRTATLTELDGVGHLSPLEAPHLVARRLGEFLRSR